MANKVKFYHLWSIRNSLITIAVLTLLVTLIGAFFYFPQLSNYYKTSRFDKQVSGTLLDIDKQTIIKQTKLGNQLDIDHFNVMFEYTVNNQRFKRTDKVNGTYVNGQQLMKKWNSDKKVTVLYESDNPGKSMIDITSN